MYGNVTGAVDNFTSVLMAKNGRVKSVRWEVSVDATADASRLSLELSTSPTNHLTTNDSIGDFSAAQFFNNLTTSGQSAFSIRKQEFVDYPVAANERLYIHCGIATTATAWLTIYIDVEE